MKNHSESILKLEYVLTGTITRRHGPCGKKNCRCSNGEAFWHGPYYVWTRKENGKTITKTLSPKQVQFCKKAIDNSKTLNEAISKWRSDSLKVLEKITS